MIHHYHHLTIEDRERVALGLAKREKIAAIARALGRDPKPIREVSTHKVLAAEQRRGVSALVIVPRAIVEIFETVRDGRGFDTARACKQAIRWLLAAGPFGDTRHDAVFEAAACVNLRRRVPRRHAGDRPEPVYRTVDSGGPVGLIDRSAGRFRSSALEAGLGLSRRAQYNQDGSRILTT